MPTAVFDFVRVSLGFMVIFGAVPRLVALNSVRNPGVTAHCTALVRASLFAEVTALLLGSVGLCLPGSTAAAYTLMLLAGPLRRSRLPRWLRARIQNLIEFADCPPAAWRWFRSAMVRLPDWRPPARADDSVMGLFAAAVALAASFYPLLYVRFLSAETYSRALSLQKLTLGQPWTPDGSVAFLAPIVFLSGCDGAAVVRFAGPLFAAFLALAAFVVARRLAGSAAALTSAGMAAAVSALADAGQVQAGAMSAIFWLLGVVLWRESRLDALGSIALALLIDPLPGREAILCAAPPLALAFVARAGPGGTRLVEALRVPVLLGAVACLIYVPLRKGSRDGPYQYEGVARAVSRIARGLPHNTWLVVSPAQELAFTYGHGWHMQLSEFVSRYRPSDVIRPEFRFGFPVATTFVFVEKQPLASSAVGSGLSALGPRFDPAMAPYQLKLSRASLQFQPGRLLAAYRARHPDVRACLEDKHVIDYRIPGQLPDAPANPAANPTNELFMEMTRRMALSALAGLKIEGARPGRLSRGSVAFHYAAVFESSAVDWYTRFGLVVTGGFLDPMESRKLIDCGTRLVAYEWSSAFYPADPVSADLASQADALKHSPGWLLNSQPVGGGAAAPGRTAFWYDFANAELRSARAAHLAARVRAGGYAGLFLDTLGFENLTPQLRLVFAGRHPGLDYNREQAAFLAALRNALGPDKILFLNQGYRHYELFLPYADFDLTESYFLAASASGTLFRPWHDSRSPWDSILTPMEQLVVPASRRFPAVKFVHLGYATGPAVCCRRAIRYNLAAARLWNQGAYLVADNPAAEQDVAYFSDLGLPLTSYGHDPGQGIAWREFQNGVVALNAGSRTASILGGRYQLPDPPQGYLFRR